MNLKEDFKGIPHMKLWVNVYKARWILEPTENEGILRLDGKDNG